LRPFAVYHTHDERYLRVFCPAHNLFAATRFYGREFIQQKIHAGRRERGERPGVGQSVETPQKIENDPVSNGHEGLSGRKP
jgi:hypothetical protein